MRHLFVCILFFAFSSSAWAGFFAEPYLGFQLGSAKSATMDDGMKGLALGGKAGYRHEVFSGGLELQVSIGHADDADETKHEQNDVGVFGMFHFYDLPVRAWITYFLYSHDDVNPGQRHTGDALKVGAGFSPLRPFYFNVEYKMSTYNKRDDVELATPLKVDSVLFTISFYFEDFYKL